MPTARSSHDWPHVSCQRWAKELRIVSCVSASTLHAPHATTTHNSARQHRLGSVEATKAHLGQAQLLPWMSCPQELAPMSLRPDFGQLKNFPELIDVLGRETAMLMGISIADFGRVSAPEEQ